MEGIVLHRTEQDIYLFIIHNNRGISIKVSRNTLSKTVNEVIDIGDEVSYELASSSTEKTLVICNVIITGPGVHKEYISTLTTKIKNLEAYLIIPLGKVIMLCLEKSKEINCFNLEKDFETVYALEMVGISWQKLNGKPIYEPMVIFKEK